MVLSTLRKIAATPFSLMVATIKPMESTEFYDVIDKDIKTAKSFKEYVDKETGWDRIKRMFQLE